MERVRQEAARIDLRREPLPASPGSQPNLPLGNIATPPPAPRSALPAYKSKSQVGKIKNLLQRGRDKNDRPGVPRFLSRLFRKQGSYNRVILESTEILERSVTELAEQVSGLALALKTQLAWSADTSRYQQEVRTWIVRAAEEFATLRVVQENGARLETFLTETVQLLRNEFDDAGQHLRNLQAEVDRLGLCLSNLQQEQATAEERMATAEEHIRSGTAEHLRNLQAEVDRLGLCVSTLQQESTFGAERLRSLDQRITDHSDRRHALQQMVSHLDERITADGAYIKAELSQQGQTLRRLAEPGARTPAKRKQAQTPAPDHSLDAFYLSFENRFRGPRGEIKKRLAFYLSYISDARAGLDDRPVLDVGCGRGEWLELLSDQSLQGRGVDLNSAMVAQCRERNLEVVEADVIDYFGSLSNNSLGAVTGFHIIEHLPLQTLFSLVTESYRTLQPGGVVVFESPNCKNLVVGACNFNIDPTHRNPVFPETAEFMFKLTGFDRVELKYLSPVESAGFSEGTPQAKVLNELLYGPQDFAVIAYKPSAI
jgi:O-antigen chain-terminating methyltransferase